MCLCLDQFFCSLCRSLLCGHAIPETITPSHTSDSNHDDDDDFDEYDDYNDDDDDDRSSFYSDHYLESDYNTDYEFEDFM